MLLMRYNNDRQAPIDAAAAPYRTGEPAAELAAVDFTKTTHTIVLFVNSTCHYCTESMPFYRRLQEAVKARGPKIRIAVVSFEKVPVTRNYLQQHQISTDEIYELPRSVTRLNATPTLLLVDRGGAVKLSVVGALPPDREDELLDAVSAL
jgi:thioredoxin-related protein